MYKAIIAIGIAAAACLAVGCGSSSDETAEAAVTKAQFIKQAGAVCSRVQKEGVNTRVAWERENGKEIEFEPSIKRILGPTLKRQADELRSLQVPLGDSAEVTRMIDNLSEAADGFTAEGSQSKRASKLQAFQREALTYGLKACGI